MALADDLGQVRKVSSGATRDLRQFQRALKGVRRIMIRAVQNAGRTVHKENARRYARALYANRLGHLALIKPYGSKHGKRKARLKLDLRPGVMRKGILKTMQSPLAFIRLPDGFQIDLEKPNLTITGRATVGRFLRNIAGKRILEGKGKDRRVVAIGVRRLNTVRKSFRVNSYLGHFADQKAPGLGSITHADERFLAEQGKEAVDEHLRTVTGASRVLGSKAAAKLKLDVRRMFA